ncbi:hypothetical protein GCM10009827_116880 [Dactylosporangium maewongense]|uniref:Uncharacterized protein n=1 Tax=Dactylosporangium maewongense TaxID=634393 RepID=A0ABP4P864_9ACTN
MGRLLVAVDPAVGVAPGELAAQWGVGEETAALGVAQVEKAVNGTMVPGLLELVVVPLAVNLASSLLYDVVRRLIVRSQPAVDVAEIQLEMTDTPSGDRVMVVRLRREQP